jgi:hypothetical protein
MREKNFHQNVDSMIQGIDAIVSKNRCSFSDEELQLLQECKSALLKFKKAKKSVIPDLNLLVKVFEILSRIFLTLNNLNELF